MMIQLTNGQINNWSFWLVKMSHHPLVKKTLVKKIVLKSTCPKWHFGQIGQGDKQTKVGVFLTDLKNKIGHDFL